jgi:hypothetical protein
MLKENNVNSLIIFKKSGEGTVPNEWDITTL